MIAAELEALRRLLFFSIPEAAALVGQVGEQAWRRWEAGARSVPDDVSIRIRALAVWRGLAVETADAQMRKAPADAALPLVWYSTAEDWATLPGREAVYWRPQQSACAELMTRFPALVLVPFDDPAYARWLAGRQDGESMRSRWAAEVSQG